MTAEAELFAAVICVYLLALTLFALPSLIAFKRGDPNRRLVLALNLSFVGWLVAVVLAVYPMVRWRPPVDRNGGTIGRMFEVRGRWRG